MGGWPVGYFWSKREATCVRSSPSNFNQAVGTGFMIFGDQRRICEALKILDDDASASSLSDLRFLGRARTFGSSQ